MAQVVWGLAGVKINPKRSRQVVWGLAGVKINPKPAPPPPPPVPPSAPTGAADGGGVVYRNTKGLATEAYLGLYMAAMITEEELLALIAQDL